jgi:AraC-like DNA-binding protein
MSEGKIVFSELPEYAAWKNMRRRCDPRQAANEPRYAGRGIGVCPEWRESFHAFYEYMKPRPSDQHSLDRFPDNDGHYEPGNVRWATLEEQHNNKSVCRFIEHDGEVLTISQWARRYDIGPSTLISRLNRGFDFLTAVTTPTGVWYPPLSIHWRGRVWGLGELARHVGINENTLYARLYYRKMTADDAVSTPVREPVTFLVRGELLTISQIADKYGYSRHVIGKRLTKYGFAPEEAITVPVNYHKGKHNVVWVEWENRLWSMKQLADHIGMAYITFVERHHKGWSVEKIIETPISNGRPPQLYDWQGEQRSIQELADIAGMTFSAMYHRIEKLKWSVEKAVTHPRRKYRD